MECLIGLRIKDVLNWVPHVEMFFIKQFPFVCCSQGAVFPKALARAQDLHTISASSLTQWFLRMLDRLLNVMGADTELHRSFSSNSSIAVAGTN